MTQSYFKPTDAGVRDIAAVFALKGWQWGGYSGPLHVPTLDEITETLNRLYENCHMLGGPFGSGSSTSGRLWVEVGSPDDGIPVGYGISWDNEE